MSEQLKGFAVKSPAGSRIQVEIKEIDQPKLNRQAKSVLTVDGDGGDASNE